MTLYSNMYIINNYNHSAYSSVHAFMFIHYQGRAGLAGLKGLKGDRGPLGRRVCIELQKGKKKTISLNLLPLANKKKTVTINCETKGPLVISAINCFVLCCTN